MVKFTLSHFHTKMCVHIIFFWVVHTCSFSSCPIFFVQFPPGPFLTTSFTLYKFLFSFLYNPPCNFLIINHIHASLYKFSLHFLYKPHCNYLSSNYIHTSLYKFSQSFLYKLYRNSLIINYIHISLYKFSQSFFIQAIP